ncbi:hypothetical protein FRC03_005825 [Tulasnella sp. 419]|nr:hypothetical protein FRC03_005825 [Tulasnella sp. 419]
MKFKGLEEWHFQFIIDLLPILLQLSLVLFLVGVVEFLWVIDWKIGMMQVILVAIGVAVYAAMLITGVISPTSPFRTPVTKYMIKFSGVIKFSQGVFSQGVIEVSQRVIEHYSGDYSFFDDVVEYFCSIGRCMRSCDLVMLAQLLLRLLLSLLFLGCWKPMAALFGYLRDCWKSIAGSFGYSGDCWGSMAGVLGYLKKKAWSLARFGDSRRDRNHRWDDEEQKAAESVVWLLEHSEHPDTTIVALDAARRLPPDLVSSIIDKPEGLKERLDEFCTGLLPPESLEPLQWAAKLSHRAVISAMAWCYVYPSWAFSRVKTFKNLDYGPPVAYNIPEGSCDIRLLVTARIRLAMSRSGWGTVNDSEWIRWLISILKSIHFPPTSDQVLIELNYGMQAPLFASLSTPVSLTQLALESLISYCHMSMCNDFPWNEVPQILEAILQADSSPQTISSVALVLASIRLVARSNLHFRNTDRLASIEDSDAELRRNYNDLTVDLHRSRASSRTVWPYVELAVSLVDGPGDKNFRTASMNIHYTLLNLTKELWRKEPPQNLRFYTGLLHLSSVYPNDLAIQELLFALLILIPEPSHLLAEQNRDNLHGLVMTALSLPPGVESPRSPHHEFLSLTSSISSDKQFCSLFSSGLYSCGSNYGIPVSLMALPLIYHRLLRLDLSMWPDSTIAYAYQITLALAIVEDQQRAADVLMLMCFLTRMMRDAQFHWPACFTSSGIKALVNSYLHVGRQLNFQGCHYEEHTQDLSQKVNKVITEHNLKNSWSGECVMLLWRGACKAFLEGRLPDNWNDAAFFKENTVDTMIQYYRHMVQQQDVEMDRDTLRNYFKTALEKGWGPHGDGQLSATKNNLGKERPQISKESLEDGSKAEVNSKGKEREVDTPPTSNGEETSQEVSAVGKQRREIECILSELGG